jgi:hypothetical protein
MEPITHTAPTSDLILELIRAVKVPVPDLLRVTRQRIDETQRENAKVLTEFLANRAASKDGLLAKAAGEAISVESVRGILGIGKAAVHKAKDEGRLLGYQEPGRRSYLFPVFQFEGAAVARWVPELIGIVGNGFAAIHFLTVERKSLKGSRFLKLIEDAASQEERDAKIGAMLKAARDLTP